MTSPSAVGIPTSYFLSALLRSSVAGAGFKCWWWSQPIGVTEHDHIDAASLSVSSATRRTIRELRVAVTPYPPSGPSLWVVTTLGDLLLMDRISDFLSHWRFITDQFGHRVRARAMHLREGSSNDGGGCWSDVRRIKKNGP